MGLLKSLFGSPERRIESYEISYVEDSPKGRAAANEFSEIMDSTKFVTWNASELKWYTFDDGAGQLDKGSLAFSANFQREYGDGTRTYLNGLEFGIAVKKSGDKLTLTVNGGAELFLVMIDVKLEQK